MHASTMYLVVGGFIVVGNAVVRIKEKELNEYANFVEVNLRFNKRWINNAKNKS